jgi:hypothetical protein
MHQTERVDLEVFFAEFIMPLNRANILRDIHYLNWARSDSYWGKVVSRTTGIESISKEGIDAPALIRSLGEYWEGQSDQGLVKLIPYILLLREELVRARNVEVKPDAPCTEFVYPLF